MPIEPPVSCTVSFPLVPSKRLIDLRQRLHRYLGGPQMSWTPCAVQHHHKIAGLRYRLTTSTVIARQAVALLIPETTKSASSVAISIRRNNCRDRARRGDKTPSKTSLHQ